MLIDLLEFWGYKWLHDEDNETVGPYENKEYEYLHGLGTENVTLRKQKLNEEVAKKNIEAVRLVQDTLMRGTSDRLNKRYKPPDEFLESLVVSKWLYWLLTQQLKQMFHATVCIARTDVLSRTARRMWRGYLMAPEIEP